ncbi:MAG: hypothetical protein ACR2JU_10350 [Nocardioidaceae bacterium]
MSEIPQTPPPPSGNGGSSSSGGVNADQMKAAVRSAHPYDLGIIAAGVLTFLLSLIPTYYTLDVGGLGDNYNAWHGFWGWFATILALAAAAILAATLLARMSLPFPVRLTVLGLFALALICTIIAGLTRGHGLIYWLSLIVLLAGLALSFLRKDARD